MTWKRENPTKTSYAVGVGFMPPNEVAGMTFEIVDQFPSAAAPSPPTMTTVSLTNSPNHGSYIIFTPNRRERADTGSRMRESRTSGSARAPGSNPRGYSPTFEASVYGASSGPTRTVMRSEGAVNPA